jgi:tyrosyl-tRNA synthetase
MINETLFEDIITDDPDFISALNGKKKYRIKWGADPSAPDLHLGHFVILNQLAVLQSLGHEIIFIIGDFTARIGDPTGKSTTRPSLTEADVSENAKTYLDQVFKVLNPQKTTVVYNAAWLSALSLSDTIKLCASHTVARMLERDDFSKRFNRQSPIGIHEFLYPLLQGYDSVHLKNDVEIGGTDQKFNLLVGRQLQKDAGQPPQSVLTLPILEGLDGVQKMSKSLNNHIALLDTPNDMFGKCMSIPDHLIVRYATLLTNPSPHHIQKLNQHMIQGENPRTIKLELAHAIVKQFHSLDAANNAQDNFINVFSKKALPNDMPEITIHTDAPMVLLTVLVDHALAPSKKEARRLIDQGAVSINHQKINDPHHALSPNTTSVIKVGKRKFLKIHTNPPN